MKNNSRVFLASLAAVSTVAALVSNQSSVSANELDQTELTSVINEEGVEVTAIESTNPVVVEESIESPENVVEEETTENAVEDDSISEVVEGEDTAEDSVAAVSTSERVAEDEVVSTSAEAVDTLSAGDFYDSGVVGQRIQKGDRYQAQAKVTNDSNTDTTVRFAVAHLGNPGHLIWEASTVVPANSTQTVEAVAVPNDSSNETNLLIFNDGNSDIIVDPSSVSIADLPYTEAELAEREAELYATLPEPSLDFRVNPYLQSPASDSMHLNWVSEFSEAGTVTLTEAGTDNTVTKTAESTYLELSEYTPAELEEVLTFDNGNGQVQSIEQGSWLLSNSNYKNEIGFDNLKADTTYNYQVVQGDSTFEGTFTTFPTATEWDSLRLIAFSDTETEPKGRLENREWELHVENPYVEGSEERPGMASEFQEKYGYATRNGEDLVRYPLTQTEALNENLKWIDQAEADALIIAGDLTQGAGYQPAWDEFWRHFAGDYTSIASEVPILSALGNWETFAALNGGYGNAAFSRNKYHDYLDTPGDEENPQYKDSYYRTDLGPVTIITLDSTKGVPTEVANDYTTGEIYSGDDSVLNPDVWATEGLEGDPFMTTDTQGSFTMDEYNENFLAAYPELTVEDTDMPTFSPGSEQWIWAEEQLADARDAGQIIIVQFHHAPYSSGVHGTAPNFEYPDNQSGVAMRVYQPMFREYGVSTVIAGHDEMFERSFVDTDNNGLGMHVYDVGVAADGLRSEKVIKDEDGNNMTLNYNTHSAWTATGDESELWQTNANGVKHLIDGGLHYGHLQIDLLNTIYGAEMTLTPVYIFPILDDNYEFVSSERRVYDDVLTLYFDENGQQITQSRAEQIIAEYNDQDVEEVETPGKEGQDKQNAGQKETPSEEDKNSSQLDVESQESQDKIETDVRVEDNVNQKNSENKAEDQTDQEAMLPIRTDDDHRDASGQGTATAKQAGMSLPNAGVEGSNIASILGLALTVLGTLLMGNKKKENN